MRVAALKGNQVKTVSTRTRLAQGTISSRQKRSDNKKKKETDVAKALKKKQIKDAMDDDSDSDSSSTISLPDSTELAHLTTHLEELTSKVSMATKEMPQIQHKR